MEHRHHMFQTLSLSATIHTLVDRSRQRYALRRLEWNDYLLADIGVSPAEALCEAAKPFWKP